MIEVVAERGYAATTVRALAGRAAVSTRTFYQHYSSKEECLLGTHELIVRQLLRRLASSSRGNNVAEDRVRRLVRSLVNEWSGDPGAARVMLVDIYTAGPTAAAQGRKGMRTIETAVDECLNGVTSERDVPARLGEGIVAGLIGVVRSRLLTGHEGDLAGLSDGLAQWAAWCCSSLETQVKGFGQPLLKSEALKGEGLRSAEPRYPPRPDGNEGPTGDRTLLLSAVAKLAAADGHECLTLKKVLDTAGLPRRSFYANFASVEDCLIAAFEQQAGEAIANASQAAEKGFTVAESVYLAISALCVRTAEDVVFANFCFGGIAAAGQKGAESHARLLTGLMTLASDTEPESDAGGGVAVEASASALWVFLENEVRMSRSCQANRSTILFTHLFLASVGEPRRRFQTIRASNRAKTREDYESS